MKSLILKLLIFFLIKSCSTQVLRRPYNFIQEPQNSSILVNFVCDAVEDVMRNETGMKRVAIVKYSTSFNDEFIDEIGKCLKSDFSVLILDFAKDVVNISLQKPSMIVMLTEKIRLVSNCDRP